MTKVIKANAPASSSTSTITAVADTDIVAVGVDLSDRDAHYACINQLGVITETGTVNLTATAIVKLFHKLLDDQQEPTTRIAIEAGAQSRWISELLADLGHEVLVANPRQLPLITDSKAKNDHRDAEMLARMARFDPQLLHPLEHRAKSQQVTLAAIRARAVLVRTRVTLIHHLRGTAKSFDGARLPHASSAHTQEFVERCMTALAPELRAPLEGILVVIREVSQQIAKFDEQIESMAEKDYPAVARLREIPGVGTLTALTFIATLGDAGRFTYSRDAASYLGLSPRQQQSGQRNPQLGITKAGDSYLRTLLVQSAHCILQKNAPDSALRRWGLKLCARGGSNAKKRAVVAVARKLAVLLHKLWVSGEHYRAFPASASSSAAA